jgi:histidinol dehydrogenase
MVRVFEVPSAGAEKHLARLERRARALFSGDAAIVAERAVADLRREGDRALARWRRRHDHSRGPVFAPPGRSRVSPSLRRAFNLALSRITAFHERQRPSAARWVVEGSLLEERILPLDSVGIYVPGGEAVYISTALMTVVPARIAGVRRIVVATPPAAWSESPALRWALARLGVEEIYLMGGAHAIAALAVGTATIPSVAKIVGPGNRFVAAAKRAVSGLVGIDSIAGPTEVAIFADGSADADWVAADLLAQAEHDEEAAAILVTTSRRLAAEVRAALPRRLLGLPERRRAAASLRRYGAIGVAATRAQAVRYLERIAPEHLGIQTADSLADARRFRRAGAVFAGRWSSEVFGDYVAGTNHVLPTAGTARFASALSVHDFVRRMAVVSLSRADARRLAPAVEILAAAEGLPAHAAAARLRRGANGEGRMAKGGRR